MAFFPLQNKFDFFFLRKALLLHMMCPKGLIASDFQILKVIEWITALQFKWNFDVLERNISHIKIYHPLTTPSLFKWTIYIIPITSMFGKFLSPFEKDDQLCYESYPSLLLNISFLLSLPFSKIVNAPEKLTIWQLITFRSYDSSVNYSGENKSILT